MAKRTVLVEMFDTAFSVGAEKSRDGTWWAIMRGMEDKIIKEFGPYEFRKTAVAKYRAEGWIATVARSTTPTRQ